MRGPVSTIDDKTRRYLGPHSRIHESTAWGNSTLCMRELFLVSQVVDLRTIYFGFFFSESAAFRRCFGPLVTSCLSVRQAQVHWHVIYDVMNNACNNSLGKFISFHRFRPITVELIPPGQTLLPLQTDGVNGHSIELSLFSILCNGDRESACNLFQRLLECDSPCAIFL